ncbi:hypothetical protein [Deinococcus altitudinis]|uniref:hypothetical protein n=1 Tax=Deinococcus altitudinis TaxID=468914 RepID=UPI003891CE85
MRKVFLLGFLTAVPLTLAAGRQYNVVVNGQVVPDRAIVENGKTYVPLSVLKLLGIEAGLKGGTLTLGAQTAPGISPGGADQRASLEGCLNETLFNGVWRLTVNGVEEITRYNGQQAGYSLNVEWRNGTTKTIDALNTGVKTITLVLDNGNTLNAENEQDLKYKSLPQAAGTSLALTFWASSAETTAGLGKPSKLLIEINPSGYNSAVTYSNKTPSFRVKLNCQK